MTTNNTTGTTKTGADDVNKKVANARLIGLSADGNTLAIELDVRKVDHVSKNGNDVLAQLPFAEVVLDGDDPNKATVITLNAAAWISKAKTDALRSTLRSKANAAANGATAPNVKGGAVAAAHEKTLELMESMQQRFDAQMAQTNAQMAQLMQVNALLIAKLLPTVDAAPVAPVVPVTTAPVSAPIENTPIVEPAAQ